MPIPDFETLMLPMLRYASEGVTSVRDAVDRASDEFNLTEEERREIIPLFQEPRMKNRAKWAITKLASAKLLERPQRAYFTITERGREFLATNPSSITVGFLERLPESNQFQTQAHHR